ncbi:MAG TPA: transposase [Bradyrhizobium sp.]|nr:transposase [Bradyrhizobium sp.]
MHWYRSIFNHVPSTKVREIAAMLKAIHAGEDLAAAREKANRVIEKLRGLRLSRAAELAETAVEATLTYYAFPEEHWRRIRTNNPLERILRDPTGALVSWARSLTVNPRSTSPPQGCATSPSRRGRPRDI